MGASSKARCAEGGEGHYEEAEQYKIYDHVPPHKPYGSLDKLLKKEIGHDVKGSIAVVLMLSICGKLAG